MHLFGTMHVGVPQFYPLEPQIMGALDAASTLALELDPDQSTAAMLAALKAHGLAPNGAAGWSKLAPAKRARLERLVRRAGLNQAAVSAFKPVLLATMLSLGEFDKLGYQPALAVDRYLAQHARASKLRVMELESLDAQLALLDRLSLDEQWRFLDETAGAIESGAQQDEARKVVDAWGSADQQALDAMSARLARDASLSGRFTREVLIDGRNDALAAIGVLHLVGPRGVPSLLRARGFKVERVY
jgi:uncharacterized protein YbaP (TraB family)